MSEPHAADRLRAPHAGPRGFFNPWPTPPHPGGRDFLRWRLERLKRGVTKGEPAPFVPNNGSSLARDEPTGAVTWVGHASLAIHDRHDIILTDPVFGSRVFLPKRRVPPGLPIASVPPNALAVVSHNHYDHLDAWTVDHLPASLAWFVPLGLGAWFRRRSRTDVVELDWWQSARRGRVTLTCLPAQHWSRRLGQARNATLWCSWLIDTGARRYFFAGDTGWFEGFAAFGRELGPIDVACLPIGSYEPRWFMKSAHLDPEGAWRAHGELGARFMVPMHWGTFALTDEPLAEPPRALARAVAASGRDGSSLRLLAVGERFVLP